MVTKKARRNGAQWRDKPLRVSLSVTIFVMFMRGKCEPVMRQTLGGLRRALAGKSDESARAPRGWTADTIFAGPVEWLISAARVILAALALLALNLDPTQRLDDGTPAQTILAGYFFYAVLVAIVSTSPRAGNNRFQIAVHAVDIGVFSALMYYSDGPASPFFVLYTFALMAATLRWNWRGAISTAVLLIGVFLLIATTDIVSSQDATRGDYWVVIRGGYLLVAGMILAYFGALREFSRDRVARLVAWPPEEVAEGGNPPLARFLSHAAQVLGADRVLVTWKRREEPAFHTAYWTGRTCIFDRHPPLDFAKTVPGELSDAVFGATDPRGQNVVLLPGATAVSPPVLADAFVRAFAVGSFSTAPFHNAWFRGRVFILGLGQVNSALLPLTEIVAARIGTALEHFGLQAEREEAAATSERVRLARDLHDGILQDLTAAQLMINALSDTPLEETRSKIREIADILAQQHQRIRSFVQATDPKPGARLWDFGVEFGKLIETLQRQWQCAVSLDVEPADLQLPGSLASQIFLLFAEALANAVQHGKAGRVTVKIVKAGAELHMRIRDDGRGFRERPDGNSDAADPFSLNQRVLSLGGKLRLSSSADGVELDIKLPVPAN